MFCSLHPAGAAGTAEVRTLLAVSICIGRAVEPSIPASPVVGPLDLAPSTSGWAGSLITLLATSCIATSPASSGTARFFDDAAGLEVLGVG